MYYSPVFLQCFHINGKKRTIIVKGTIVAGGKWKLRDMRIWLIDRGPGFQLRYTGKRVAIPNVDELVDLLFGKIIVFYEMSTFIISGRLNHSARTTREAKELGDLPDINIVAILQNKLAAIYLRRKKGREVSGKTHPKKDVKKKIWSCENQKKER